MKAAIYARVRTTGNHSVEMQLRDLREMAASSANTVTRASVGAKDSRPALDTMLAYGRAGRFEAVLVWKSARLGRSLLQLVRLLEEFRRNGVELVSFSEGLFFTTTTGKLTSHSDS